MNSSSISETMKENILISPQPFAIVGGSSVAKVKMLVASSVSVVQYPGWCGILIFDKYTYLASF